MAQQILSTGTFTTARWIVSSDATQGSHTTITAAIASAVSGETIFIRPGTYTENFTLKQGVNLAAYNCDSATPNVTIIGKVTYTAAGEVSVTGIRFQTNGDFFLVVSGSNLSFFNFYNCYLNCTNNTGISLTNSNAGTEIFIFDSEFATTTSGIALYSSSGAGGVILFRVTSHSSGGSSTPSNNSAGSCYFHHCDMFHPISASGTGYVSIEHCALELDNTAITLSNTSSAHCAFNRIRCQTASAISVGSGCVIDVFDSLISSTNTNAITGAGTLNYSAIVFTNTDTINPTTITRLVFDGGKYKGRTSNVAPEAGMLGEQIRGAATAVGATSTVPFNVTSIALTPGVWDITGVGNANSAGGTGNAFQLSISTTSATIQGNRGDQYQSLVTTLSGTSDFATSVPNFRVLLSANTTYYLVSLFNFATSTGSVSGRISAVRVA